MTNMTITHISGPWGYGFPIVNGEEIRDCDCQVTKDGCLIANVSHGPIFPYEPFGSAQREANAALIAAAPDLLEALKHLVAIVRGECPHLLNEDSGGSFVLDAEIDAAIAKAEGR